MFFSKIYKQWQKNRAMEKELALLEKKTKARNECRGDAFLFFVVGTLATAVLSGIFTMMIFANMSVYKYGGDLLSIVNTILIIGNIFIYLWLIYGIILSVNYALRSAKIYFQCLWMNVEEYDLENEPSFRI